MTNSLPVAQSIKLAWAWAGAMLALTTLLEQRVLVVVLMAIAFGCGQLIKRQQISIGFAGLCSLLGALCTVLTFAMVTR